MRVLESNENHSGPFSKGVFLVDFSKRSRGNPSFYEIAGTFATIHTRGSAASCAADLWKLQRKPPELLGRGLRPFFDQPDLTILEDRSKRAPAARRIFQGAARSAWSNLGVELDRCYPFVVIARIRCLRSTSCRMPCIPHAFKVDGDARRNSFHLVGFDFVM
jgi:hypothetical protein